MLNTAGLISIGGSSPRVRGTRGCCWLFCCGGRFIPAGAGNAPDRAARAMLPSVHPRGCGER